MRTEPTNARLAALAERCSQTAWSYLERSRDHPHFTMLIDRLEATPGAIISGDIDQVLRDLMVDFPPATDH